MYASQLDTYRQAQQATLSGREIEAAVLTKAALLLKDCQDHWDAADRTDKLGEAVRYSQKIWSIFQADLAKADHPLPRKLREDILSLSVFLDRRMIDVLAYPEPCKLDVIIKANLNLAAGLRGR